MNQETASVLSDVFKYLTYTTPLIAFFIVRKNQTRILYKILKGVLIAVILALLFLVTSMLLLIEGGKIT